MGGVISNLFKHFAIFIGQRLNFCCAFVDKISGDGVCARAGGPLGEIVHFLFFLASSKLRNA